MLQLEVLVVELLSVDGFSASAIMVCEVTSLTHELRDDTMERRALVSETVLASAEFSEVSCCARDNIVIKLEFYPSNRLAGDRHVKEDVGFRWTAAHHSAEYQ